MYPLLRRPVPPVSLIPTLRPLAFAPPLQLRHTVRPLHSTSPRPAPTLSLRHQAPKTKNVKRPRSLVAPPGSPEPHRIAVVGAGLAGLAVAYHLTHSADRYARKRGLRADALRVTVLDPFAPGTAGASAAAAGLLHDFAPRPKTKLWQATKGFDSALRLLEAVGASVHTQAGILRVSRSPRDDEDFAISARRFPSEIQLLEPDDLTEMFPHVAAYNHNNAKTLHIRRGRIVDTPAYLRALWATVAASGRAAFRTTRVDDINSLYSTTFPATSPDDFAAADSDFDGPFDTVVIATGAATKLIQGLPPIPMTSSRGTNIIVESHTHTPPNIPLLGSGYVVPDLFTSPTDENGAVSPSRLLVGTSRMSVEAEHTTPARRPVLQEHFDEMRKAVHTLTPGLFDDWTATHALVGDRALPRRTKFGSIPIACRLSGAPEGTTAWLLTGLAGRGLLYHAYLGRVIAHAVVAGNERLIPTDTRRFDLSLQLSPDLADPAECPQPHVSNLAAV